MKFRELFDTLSTPDKKKFCELASLRFANYEHIRPLVLGLTGKQLDDANIEKLQDDLMQNRKSKATEKNVFFNRQVAELTRFLEDFIVSLELEKDKLLKDLILLKYYRKKNKELSATHHKEVLHSFKEHLEKEEVKDWEFHYKEFKFLGYELEFGLTHYPEKERKEKLAKVQEERNKAFHQAFASEYLYEVLLNKKVKKMPFHSTILKYLGEKTSDMGLSQTLKQIEELLQNTDFSPEKCELFFDLSGECKTPEQAELRKVSADAKQNIFRLFLERFIQLVGKDTQYYSNLYNFFLAGYHNNCLLINGDIPESELRRLLISCMYKHQSEMENFVGNAFYEHLIERVKNDFPNIKTLKNKPFMNHFSENVIAQWRFQKGDFKKVYYETLGTKRKTPYFMQNLFFCLFAMFEMALQAKNAHQELELWEVNKEMRKIKNNSSSPAHHSSLKAFELLLKCYQKNEIAAKQELTTYLAQSNAIFQRNWILKKLEECHFKDN